MIGKSVFQTIQKRIERHYADVLSTRTAKKVSLDKEDEQLVARFRELDVQRLTVENELRRRRISGYERSYTAYKTTEWPHEEREKVKAEAVAMLREVEELQFQMQMRAVKDATVREQLQAILNKLAGGVTVLFLLALVGCGSPNPVAPTVHTADVDPALGVEPGVYMELVIPRGYYPQGVNLTSYEFLCTQAEFFHDPGPAFWRECRRRGLSKEGNL